tara:strand:- start:9826 stop:10113 length:288 start_codon:yes stop_codon:yes gene_type:complete
MLTYENVERKMKETSLEEMYEKGTAQLHQALHDANIRIKELTEMNKDLKDKLQKSEFIREALYANISYELVLELQKEMKNIKCLNDLDGQMRFKF